MKKLIGIYQIKISERADINDFENYMKSIVFSTLDVGKQTRGGLVTKQYLVKEDSIVVAHDYSWVVHWENQGGSPFGAENKPADPANLLTDFGVKTSFTRYVVL